MVQGLELIPPAPLGVHSKRLKRPPSIENDFLFGWSSRRVSSPPRLKIKR